MKKIDAVNKIWDILTENKPPSMFVDVKHAQKLWNSLNDNIDQIADANDFESIMKNAKGIKLYTICIEIRSLSIPTKAVEKISYGFPFEYDEISRLV
jgi:hypothetical protein